MITSRELARAFAQEMQRELGRDILLKIDALNAGEENPGVCHSHDFCDSNQIMLDAIANMEGDGVEVPGVDEILHDVRVAAIVDEAWHIVRRTGFSALI